MTPNTIVRCIDDRQSEGRLVKGRLYVVSKVWSGETTVDFTPGIPGSGTAIQLYGVWLPSRGGVKAENSYWKSSRFTPVNRKDLETELLSKVADKIVGGVK